MYREVPGSDFFCLACLSETLNLLFGVQSYLIEGLITNRYHNNLRLLNL